MKKIISFFVIAVCLLFTIQLTSCSDKTDSPEVPVIPENPENPRDEAYYDSYIETVENLSSQLNNGTITTNGQLIELAKNYDNFKSVTEHDGVVYLEFDGGWTYFVDFEGRTAVPSLTEEDIDFSEFDELLSELEEFDNDEPEDDSRSDVQESRAATNPEYLPSKFKVLYWGPFDKGEDESNYFDEACKLVKIDNKPVIEYKSIYGDQCSLNDFNKFCDYDLVIFATHGCKGGMPLVPNTMKGISSLTDQLPKGRVKDIECTVFDYNFLSEKLPALGNTVVWTLMCYSFCENSTMASVAKQKSAGDYFGATGTIYFRNNFELFVPFIARLYKGALSADAFIPGGSGDQGYEYYDGDGQVKGIFHHNGFDGVCFPFTSVYKPVDNHPVAVFQAPSGELDKVLKGNGSFKAGIEVKNTSTSKITKIELTTDNISASSHKEYEQIIDRNKYTFKTDGLEAGTYEYRSYIEFPKGKIKYSENTETFEVLTNVDGDYFELYFENDKSQEIEVSFHLTSHDVNKVLCDGLNWDKWKSSYEFCLNIKPGLHHYRFYFSGKLDKISISEETLCGGYIPQQITYKYGNYYKINTKVKELSATKRGDYVLTLPHVREFICESGSNLLNVDLSKCLDLEFINFGPCPSLSSVNLSGCSNLKGIKKVEGVYFGTCPSLSSVNLSGCSNLTKIEKWAFDGCSSLSSIDLSGCSNLTKIEKWAFKGCSSLSSIDLSGCSNLTYFGSYAFHECASLSSIYLSGCSNLKEIEEWAFWECSSLPSVDLSKCANLKKIGRYAFEGCSSLSSINLSRLTNLTEIEYGAFSGCSSLSSIDLSGCSNLTKIGDSAFSACSSLPSIDLSGCSNLTEIGGFSECSSLTSIDLSGCSNLTKIGGFSECSSLSSVNLSGCSNLTYFGGFSECSSLSSVNLSGCTNLTYFGGASECSSLSSVNLSGCSNLTYFGGAYGCSSLSSVDLSKCANLTEIGGHAFYGCSSLSSINLSGLTNLKEIAYRAFYGCSSLSSINLSELTNLTKIGDEAFYNCNLTEVTIPAKVVKLDYDTFFGCPIRNVYCYPINPPCSGYNPFPHEKDNYAKIYVPASSVEIYKEKWGVWERYWEGDVLKERCLNIFPM